MQKQKKDIRGAGPDKRLLAIIILAVAIILVAGAILAMRLSGYRRMTVRYVSSVDASEQEISFAGFVYRDGSLRKGTLYYENVRAEVKALGDEQYRLEFSNGDVYEGRIDGLQRQGYGKMTYATGEVYEGSFENDKFHGNGIFTYAGGDVYDGSFAGGKKSGRGTYTWAKVDGKGATYVGAFKNDRRNGYGTYTESDGTVYSGNFVDDLREDESAEVYIVTEKGGVDRYYGGYHRDVRDGFGYYFYANGDVYVGQFALNNINGHGIIYRLNGDSYEGEFEKGNIKRSDATEISPEEAAEKITELQKQFE